MSAGIALALTGIVFSYADERRRGAGGLSRFEGYPLRVESLGLPALLALAVAWGLRRRWAADAAGLARGLRRGPASRTERLAVLGAAGALAAAVWVAALTPNADLLELHVLDVGQGDALLIVTPDGASALVDGGPDPRLAVNRVDAALPLAGMRIDLGALTHGHADHAAGFLEMARRGRLRTVLVPPPSRARMRSGGANWSRSARRSSRRRGGWP